MEKDVTEAQWMILNGYDESVFGERTGHKKFPRLNSGDLVSKTGIGVDEKKYSKIQNWRLYLTMTWPSSKNNRQLPTGVKLQGFQNLSN